MKIGIFDSGYGGLTILEKIVEKLPQYDYVYFGDNARTPYGPRSFEVVYSYTLECVKKLFSMGCELIIIACNTASAKALRTIQQNDLPSIAPQKRVLGVIRPTAEEIDKYTNTGVVGIWATTGTVQSKSYDIEIKKLFPKIEVVSEACPMWVQLIENNEYNRDGADFFVKQHINNLLSKNKNIDAIILGCTHYPLLLEKIELYLPKNIKLVVQGDIVAKKIEDYLIRHSDIEKKLSKNTQIEFCTTESEDKFRSSASIFLNKNIKEVKRVILD